MKEPSMEKKAEREDTVSEDRDDILVLEEIEIEEVAIDGICGVY